MNSLTDMMNNLGRKTKVASKIIAHSSDDQRQYALHQTSKLVRERIKKILSANDQDMIAAKTKSLSPSMLDRLRLTPARVNAMATGLEAIASQPDPLGTIISEWTRPNGLTIQRVRTPLGVIGVIYESRPNVTIDAGALCLKAGNGVILRGGSESHHSSHALHQCLSAGLQQAGLPEAAITLVPTTDRAAVGALLGGLGGTVDVIIPRGGKSLVARVQEQARVPVIGHLDGLCHVYVDRAADPAKALAIVLNAKMRRPGVCGAAETLLVDRACADTMLPMLIDTLTKAGCALRADAAACAIDSRLTPASATDWTNEYLAPILSIALVDGVDGAISHIDHYSSGHTESIITESQITAEIFLTRIDSAIVMHNASTQFSDGGEFGMGAEIGIATGRIHARGPVGVEQLTLFKYIVRGTGQVRPE